jgi:O-antigen ligase
MSSSVNSLWAGKAGNPLRSIPGMNIIAFLLIGAAFLSALDVSLMPLAVAVAASILLYVGYRHPIGSLGIFLAFMPIFPLAYLLCKFFGPSTVKILGGCDRIILLLLVCFLWLRNRLTLAVPDLFLAATFVLALSRYAFDGALLPLFSDFNFIIAYVAGRVTVLNTQQESLWARRAVWIVAILSLIGMVEVFYIGDAPRTALYLSVAEGATDAGALNGTFHADQFAGLRESSTMLGPLQFASLCMATVIIWLVFCQSPIAACLVAAGLICSVTRSAWLGTAVAIPVLAVAMHKQKKLILLVVLSLALFAALIPILNLGDFLLLNRRGQDASMEGHKNSVVVGLDYIKDHPLGAGPGNAGSYATKENVLGVFIENSYATFAAEYGIVTCLCFIGFLVSALSACWRARPRKVGYVAVGILVGFATVMMVAPLHEDFPLATWIWFPVGLAVRASQAARNRQHELAAFLLTEY